MPLLFNSIVRFCSHIIGMTSDVEKAFLQIGIAENDRNYLCFLCYDDPFEVKPNVVHYRICRLPFGIKSSPSILGATIRHHVSMYQEKEPQIATLLNNLYADDMFCGADSREKALEIYRKSKAILKEGGFNLRKWNSNGKSLLAEMQRSIS